MSVLLFLIVLGVLVLSHEFGHFIVAKKSGIRVDEFGFGFPPRIFGFKRGETVYSLNLLPFGGFVKIFGENPDQESLVGADSGRSLTSKPRYIQAAVLVAGVVCNLLIAWLFLSVGFMSGLPVSTSSGMSVSGPTKLLITSVRAGSPAEQSGLKPGDEILTLASSKNIKNKLETLAPVAVQEFIAENGENNLTLEYQRGAIKSKTEVTPVAGLVANRVAVGITMDQVGISQLGIFPALWQGAKLTANLTLATVAGLWQLLTQAVAGQAKLDNITGPVGLAGLVSDAAGLGWVYLLSFTAFISINLAVLNLVPFPALDGGRLLFLLIEKIKGSSIKPQVANTLNLVGFGLLLLLMAVVTYGDIRHLLLK